MSSKRAKDHLARFGKDFTVFCKMNGFSCTFHNRSKNISAGIENLKRQVVEARFG